MPKDAVAAFGATLAERYDRHLVPLLFAPYAEFLAERAKTLRPDTILEIAAGTGVLTQALATILPAEVAITATDLSAPMIDRARSKSTGSSVRWQQADAMQLPFPEDAFDLIVCQFGVMFFPDRKASFLEAARLLKPRGHYLCAVWDDWKKMPDAPLAIAAEVVAEMLSCDPASLVNPAYYDETTIRRDLTAAQFQDVEVDRVTLPATARPHERLLLPRCKDRSYAPSSRPNAPVGSTKRRMPSKTLFKPGSVREPSRAGPMPLSSLR